MILVDTTYLYHEFQFHKGTIRTRLTRCTPWGLPNFNSIKVRLEPLDSATQSDLNVEFQFHKGTIRTNKLSTKLNKDFNFNSIKVRLELSSLESKASRFKFQFHKGTIRTNRWL